MPWVAIEEQWKEDKPRLWEVAYEVTDESGTSGYVRLLADGLLEEEARLIAQRLNA